MTITHYAPYSTSGLPREAIKLNFPQTAIAKLGPKFMFSLLRDSQIKPTKPLAGRLEIKLAKLLELCDWRNGKVGCSTCPNCHSSD